MLVFTKNFTKAKKHLCSKVKPAMCPIAFLGECGLVGVSLSVKLSSLFFVHTKQEQSESQYIHHV
jgi:hypothetical protein